MMTSARAAPANTAVNAVANNILNFIAESNFMLILHK